MSFAICFGASALGGLFTSSSVGGWYLELQRPSWNPPGWVFGPVWTALYATMALSLWDVWKSAGPKRFALGAFSVQLLLNIVWSLLFFGLQSPGSAFAEILVLLVAILATIVGFYRVSPRAGILLIPYFLWTSFAAVLNGTIWSMN